MRRLNLLGLAIRAIVLSPNHHHRTVSPLQKGVDEADYRPLNVSKPVMFHLEANKHVQVHIFNGKPYVSIREFYRKQEMGELLPGRKGLNLTVQQWGQLKQLIPQMNQSVTNSNKFVYLVKPYFTKYHLQPEKDTIAKDKPFKMVGLTYFKGKTYVSLREHKRYKSHGKMYPSKKGINLTEEQWMWFESIVLDIDGGLQKMDEVCVVI